MARRTRDAALLEDDVEFLAVLGGVDRPCRGAEDRNAQLLKVRRKVDGGLAAELNDRVVRLLGLDDAGHVLRGQRLEVQTVSGVEVSGDGLRVVVDDDGLAAELLQCPDRVNRAVVELDALTDADRAGAENEDLLLAGRGSDLALLVIGGVVVRGLRLELSSAGIYHLVDRQTLDIGNVLAGELLDGLVEEAHLLGADVQVGVDLLGGRQLLLHVDDVLELVQEEYVHRGDLVDLVDGHDAAAQRLADVEQTLVVRAGHALLDLGIRLLLDARRDHAVQLDLTAANGLHQRALKGVVDGHDLTGGLHLGAEGVVRVDELVERPARELDDTVVEGRLEAGLGLAGDGVRDLVQTVADRDLCRYLCDRVAGRLGSQCGGTGNTRVYLDNGVLEGFRIERVLHVAAALDAQLGDDVERGGAEHLILLVAQGLRRRNNDRVAGVDADRVNVLHVTDGDGVALVVAHDLVLDFLPAGDALLDKNLVNAGVHDAGGRDLAQLLPGVGDAAAGAAEGVRRADDDRQTDLAGEIDRILDRVNDLGGNDRLADLLHGVLEHLAVLRLCDGGRVRAEQLYAHLLEEAVLAQLHGEVQTGLTAEVGQQRVRVLLLDDLLNGLYGHRLDVNLVCHGLVGHDGCRVGVDQNDLQTLFAQCAAGLRACIVELGRLTDYDRAGAQYHYLMNILAKRHY